MEERTLGRELVVSAVGLGCMGMSEFYGDADEERSVRTIRRADAVHPITALQTEYSLWTRHPEEGILETVRELGIGFVAYSPLGRGFLSGRVRSPHDLDPDDWRRDNPRFRGENFRRNLELVDVVDEVAGERGATPARVALAWVLSRGDDIVAVPGTTSPEHVVENARAAELELTDGERARLEAVFAPGAAAGDRYPEMGSVDG